MRWLRQMVMSFGLLAVAGCEDVPRDPDRTLEQVQADGVMRIVAVDYEPWVIPGERQAPTGVEVELVEAFAQDLGVEIEWHCAPAFKAFEALDRGDADLAIGGFTMEAVEAHETAAPTYAYFTEELMVAAEPDAPLPEDLKGRSVYVPPDLLAHGLVEEKGATPVSAPGEAVDLVVLPSWQVPDSNLVPTSVVLRRDDHVLAVPPGENAWLMRLERFLREGAGDVGARLREHAL